MPQDAGPQDHTTQDQRTEVQRMKIGNATSEVTTAQLARELCGDGDDNVEL